MTSLAAKPAISLSRIAIYAVLILAVLLYLVPLVVMLHGCTIGDNSLIGIQAVVLNNARIGRNCIVGAGSVVTEGKEFPDNSLIIGSPARVVRTLDAAAAEKLAQSAEHYAANGHRYARGLKKIG